MKIKRYALLLAMGSALGFVLTGSAATRYVAVTNAAPAWPYTNWATAACVIQEAVDAADPGDEILVADGVYATGGRAVYGAMTNRVAIDKAVIVRSVNGPNLTWIVGQGAGGVSNTNGDGAIRCVYVGANAVLSGFTLTNGHTRSIGDYDKELSGGGAWCEASGLLTNCNLIGNSAGYRGGGASYGMLNNCILTGNSADYGGGAYFATLNNCTLAGNSAVEYGGGTYHGTLNNCTLARNSAIQYGGGAYFATLNNCTLTGNSAVSGGGAYESTLNNCTLTGNSAGRDGGGAYGGTLNNCTLTYNASSHGGGACGSILTVCELNNCTLTYNTSSHGGGAYWATLKNCTLSGNSAGYYGGGAYYGTLTNCIVYYNTAPNGPDYFGSAFAYSCTTPLPSGTGNIDSDPLLASATHLSAQSPCIGRGSPAYASGVDIDGEAWLNPPCMGADQFVAGGANGELSVSIVAAYTNVATGISVSFAAQISGPLTASVWNFGDGVMVSNRVYASHAWAVPGLYEVRLTGYNDSFPGGVSATVLVQVAAQEVYYVNIANATPVFPYTNWAGAATNIQEAIDAGTQIGRLVRVTNGVYATGGRAVVGTMTNRVVIPDGVEVRSESGPLVTIIAGQAAPGSISDGDGAIRCVYVGTNAVLSGFTLTNGHTRIAGDYFNEHSGGGAYCEWSGVVTNCSLTGNSAYGSGGSAYSGILNNCTLKGNSAASGGGAYSAILNNCMLMGNSARTGGAVRYGTLNNCTLTGNSAIYGGGAASATLTNCTLAGNSVSDSGGGAYSGTLNNCILRGNSAAIGGGAYFGILNNCTVTRNISGSLGGGAYLGTLNNCIIYHNMAPNGSNYYDAICTYSCTTPLPSGEGNIDTDPLLASTTHISAQSPCIGRGSPAYASGVDIDGEDWLNPPCMGADQFVPGSATGELRVAIDSAYTNVVTGLSVLFIAQNSNPITATVWDFGDGVVVSNRCYASHAWAVPGLYEVRLTGYNDSFPGGVTATVLVRVAGQEVYYVNAANLSPVFPYTNWAGAGTNIQEAIDAGTQVGRLVRVTNGFYNSGGRAVCGTMTNRVVVPEWVEVRSENGPLVTIVGGQAAPGDTSNGDGAVRCVYVGSNAVLSGFTLTNGHTRSDGNEYKELSGGGAWCEASGLVANCTLTGNSAYWYGGGACSGTLKNCTLSSNSASQSGGAASGCTVNRCTLQKNWAAYSGGGACNSALSDCTLIGNISSTYGGGIAGGVLYDCTITGNSARSGGGASEALLNNCTLMGNAADTGGGAHSSGLNNCILTANSAKKAGGGVWESALTNCTLAGNSANFAGGGAYAGIFNNCIVYYNGADNYYGSYVANSCTTPQPGGVGNITNAPLFMDTNGWSNLRLQSNSPCINAGNNVDVAGDKDLDGRARIVGQTVDLGAFEYQGPGMSEFIPWLQQYGLPRDGSGDRVDSDADGASNWQEWLSKCDPTNPGSVLRLLPPVPRASDVQLRWQSVAGVLYQLEYCTNLATSTGFQALSPVIPGETNLTSFYDTNATWVSPRFYRVRALGE